MLEVTLLIKQKRICPIISDLMAHGVSHKICLRLFCGLVAIWAKWSGRLVLLWPEVLRHNSPFSAKLQIVPATIKWSSTLISNGVNTCFKLFVSSTSAPLGSATPIGWLREKMTATALFRSASLTMSRGYTDIRVSVPRDNSSLAISRDWRKSCVTASATAITTYRL